MKRLLVLILVALSLNGFSQFSTNMITIDTIAGPGPVGKTGAWYMILTYPENIDQVPDSLLQVVFSFTGAGEDAETGWSYSAARLYGIHREMLRTGWNGVVPLANGVQFSSIAYCTVQVPDGGVTTPAVRTRIEIILNRLRVKRNGIRGVGKPDMHMMGFSQGASFAQKYSLYQVTLGDSSFARMVNSVWMIMGVSAKDASKGVNPLAWPQSLGSWAKNQRGRLVYNWNQGETDRGSTIFVKGMNDSMPGSAVQIYSNYGLANCGHCRYQDGYNINRTWQSGQSDINHTKFFNTANVETTPQFSLNQTWAQWFVRNGDTVQTSGNVYPVVSITPISPITLPTNNANLNGGATDGDGTIASYLWTRLSGPVTYTIGDNTDPTTTLTNLVSGTYVFELAAIDNVGAKSANTVTIVVNPEPGNEPPTVSAGGDKAITLPTDEIELAGIASDPDGSISTYTWTKISGGSATIVSPSSATTDITGLTQGSYVFQLTVQDNEGSTAFDQVTISVAGAGGANKVINVAVNGITGLIKNPEWNNWTIPTAFTTGSTSQAFNYSDGSSSTISVSMSRHNGVVNNGSTYKGFPGLIDTALQYVSNSNYPRTLTFSGFDNAKFYNLLFYGSRNSAGYRTKFTVNGTSVRFTTSYNKNADSVALFSNIQPSGGQIVVTIDSAFGTSKYNHLNAFTITEISSAGGNQLPVADAGNNDTLTLPTSSTTLDGTGSNDPDGSITAYLWTQLSGPNTATIVTPTADQTSITGLIRGTYWFQLRVTDNLSGQSFSQVMVRVNSSTNEPPVAFAGNDTTIMAQSSTLSGTAFDWDGAITGTKWNKISGPLSGFVVRENNLNTELFNLAVGEYQFELVATDNNGATGKDTVKITVIEEPVIICKAEAGPDQVLPVGTYSTELIGTGSFGEGTLSHTWRLITNVPNDYTAKIKHADSMIADVMLLPFVDGGYQFEHMITDTGGCVSKDTVRISIDWGAFPPQSSNSNGWRRVTAADTTAVNAIYGPGYWKVNDVYIDGANQGAVTGGNLDINLTGVTNLFITPGQKIWIRAGHYRNFRFVPIAGQVAGSAAQKIQISNFGGQVRCQSFTISNIKHVKITGKYVKGVSGHRDYQGHDSSYAWSRRTYGLCLDNEHSSKGAALLRVAGTTTDSCEFEYLEAGNGGFTGMMFKNDNTPETWKMDVHDCYIYGPDGEGVYWGSTSGTNPQNQMKGWKAYNLRIAYTGNEIFQFNQIYEGTDIYNNVFIGSAMRFKTAFSRHQSFSIQNQFRAGNSKLRNNLSIGFRESMYNSSYGSRTGTTVGNDTVYIQNNLHLYGTGYLGGYFSDGSGAFSGMVVKITDNLYGRFNFRGNEYYTGTEATNQSTVLKTDAAIPKFYTRNNVIDGSGGKTVFMTGIGLDSSGNTTASVPLPQFVNSGWPADFNFNYYEMWMDSVYSTFGDEFANQVGVNTGAPITYDSGRYVLHGGLTYRSLQNSNHGHMPKGRTDAWWKLITWSGPGGKVYYYPADDYRLVTGSYYQQRGMGLLQSATIKRKIKFKLFGRVKINHSE